MDNLYLRFDDTIAKKLIKCKQCGKCCSGITFDKTVLTNEDVIRIEKGLNSSLEKLVTKERLKEIKINDNNQKIILQPCPFLKENKCSIYKYRPLSCRQYPLYCGEGTIKIDEINCPAGKELYDRNKKRYALYRGELTLDNKSILGNAKVIDTKTKGEDIDWNKLFLFNGKLFNYYLAAYNNTSLNEREIEIPIIIDYIRKFPAQNILEIGNVLSHYFSNVSHDIIDKDEKVDKVINEDIVTYKTDKLYDLIISISTMEHVGMEGDGIFKLTEGWVQKGFENVKTLLAPNGKFVFTIPLYFHLELDHLLKTGKLKFDEYYCMERDMESNKWSQIEFSSIKDKPWNNFVQNAIDKEGNIYALRRIRYLLIGIING